MMNVFSTKTSMTVDLLYFLFVIIMSVNSAPLSSRDVLAKVGETYSKPEQIHISFGSSSRDIVIMWSSSTSEKSFVEFGNSHNSIFRVESTTVELKNHSEHALKFIHRAELKNLDTASRYTYRIVNRDSQIRSNNYKFDVPHNDEKKAHTFFIIADMGLQTKSLQFVVHEALKNNYEAVFHIGDIGYNLDLGGGKVGDKYMNQIEKMAAQVPYMTTPGDHERFYDFYHYRYRFSTPNSTWPMREKDLWYSIDIGHVHFISLNTEYMTDKSIYANDQIKWLLSDLKMANKNRHLHPWVIVLGHKPLYCTKSVMAQECDKEVSEMRILLEDIFFEYGVDLYLCGHKHIYERSWPMYKGHPFNLNYINPDAPIQIIFGAMGYEYLTDKQMSQASWLAFVSSDRQKELFANLTTLNSTHLLWSARNAFNNEEVDFIQVVQKNHSSFGKPGMEALKKIHPGENSLLSMGSNSLPPAPYTIVDESPRSFFMNNRQFVLFSTVFSLSLILFFFLRHSKVRAALSLLFIFFLN